MLGDIVKLNNGHTMPCIGLGTWQSDDKEALERAVRHAIKIGYRHIDTAHIYGIEKALGEILKKIFEEKLVKREELFITSKLFNNFHNDPEKGLKITLEDLQLDYLDLYLIHWPVTFKVDEQNRPINEDGKRIIENFDAIKLWKEFERFVEKGWVRSIGFSNFGKKNTSKILSMCKVKPAVSQFEIHPYLTQFELVDYFKSHNITVVSYSSLGSTAPNILRVRDDQTLKDIAKNYNKTVAQVILSWLRQRDILIIPKSLSEKHIEENGKLFKLKEEDFNRINQLNRDYRYVDIPEWGPNRFD